MQIERHSPIKCYAGQSRDSEKLKHSASGAAFQMLAEIVLEMGGVCYGCAGKMINGEYSAYHVRVTNVDELQSILNSKYILSHIGTTYQQIKEDLKNGKLVLFGGTPCQALGLKSFLNNEYENLIVVDVICHGVTSKTIFNDYLREVEKEQNIVITDYIFRDKKAGWGSNFCYSYYNNGDKNKIKIKRFPKEGASHEIHYLRGDISRENCFSCEMSNTNRVSDFTFGDYWAIEIEHPEFIVRNDPALSIRKGINCMMVNTEKGMQYLSKLQEKMVMYVHTPIPGAIVRIATRRKRKEGCVVVYTTHGLTFPKGSSLKTKIVYGGVEWFCSWMTDGIITINKEDYTQMKKMACKNVYHINGVGVDTSRYHECQIDRDRYRESLGLSESDIAILEVGELSTRKNHKVIIEALSKINDKHYVFLICGKAMSNSGTYDFLKKYAEEKNVRVIFLGFRKDIPEINRCADIAVLPSLREGLGLAGIEALASGVPVVGSNVQGIKDYVIDGQTGYLCSPRDADAFADKIQLLSDKEARFSMRKACVEKAEEFRLDISHQQMKNIYKNLLREQERVK